MGQQRGTDRAYAARSAAGQCADPDGHGCVAPRCGRVQQDGYTHHRVLARLLEQMCGNVT